MDVLLLKRNILFRSLAQVYDEFPDLLLQAMILWESKGLHHRGIQRILRYQAATCTAMAMANSKGVLMPYSSMNDYLPLKVQHEDKRFEVSNMGSNTMARCLRGVEVFEESVKILSRISMTQWKSLLKNVILPLMDLRSDEKDRIITIESCFVENKEDESRGPFWVQTPFIPSACNLHKWCLKENSLSSFVEIVPHILKCVASIHLAGVFHGGITTETFIVTNVDQETSANENSTCDNLWGRINVADARSASHTHSQYSAPELREQIVTITEASDCYSVGVVLFQCMTEIIKHDESFVLDIVSGRCDSTTISDTISRLKTLYQNPNSSPQMKVFDVITRLVDETPSQRLSIIDALTFLSL